MARWATACVLAACLCLVGCSSTGGDPPGARGPTSTTGTDVRGPAQLAPVTQADDVQWEELGPWPRGQSPRVVSTAYVAVTSDRDRVLELRRRTNQQVAYRHRSASGFHVSEVFLDGKYLVVVESHDQEEQPDRPTVVDTSTGAQRTLGADAPPPAIGSWAVGDGTVYYNTEGRSGDYCAAEADLSTLAGAVVDCVGRRHGITQLTPSQHGLGFVTFDDQRPLSCMTPRTRTAGAEPTDLPGIRRCRSWEVLLAGDGTVLWSVVTKPQRIEVAQFYVRDADGQTLRLGEATTGSLIWCGDAAWFVRQMKGVLMRWTPDGGLQETFRLPQPQRQGVISTPVCGGDTVAVIESRDSRGGDVEEAAYAAPVTAS